MNGKTTPPTRKDKVKDLMKAMLRGILHNGGFKLLALVLAVVLWAGLIAQDPTLTREKTFDNVSVSISGKDAIKRNGFIVVSDLEADLEGVSIQVNVPQMQYQLAQAAAYNVRVELSRITEPGVQDIPIVSSNSSAYGNVLEIEPDRVQIEVEEYVTRYRVPVSVEVVGNAPEGYYATEPDQDPPTVIISGPKSLVDSVVRVKAVIDQSTLPQREGQVRTAVPFELVDSQGNPVESDLLEVTSESSVLLDSVVVEQDMYSLRSIELSDVGLVTGEPAKGYEIKSITITPERVTAAGSSADLDLLNALFTQGSINVEGLTEAVSENLRLRRPSELAYLSTDSVNVTVDIGPVIRTRIFDEVPVTITGLAEGLTAEAAASVGRVTISGPVTWIESLKAGWLTLSCDASGLAAGEYQLPLICQVENSEEQSYTVELQPETIGVQIIGP